MVGFVLVTHDDIGKIMLDALGEIIKEKPNILHISVRRDEVYQEAQGRIHQAIQSFSHLEGVILLVDLFGATPCNLCKEFLKNGEVEMVTGINLPVLIKAATTQFKESPAQVAQFLKDYAKDSIRVYSTDY